MSTLNIRGLEFELSLGRPPAINAIARHWVPPRAFERRDVFGDLPGAYACAETNDRRTLCAAWHGGESVVHLPVLTAFEDNITLLKALQRMGARGASWSPEGSFVRPIGSPIVWDVSEPHHPCWWLLTPAQIEILLRDGELSLRQITR